MVMLLYEDLKRELNALEDSIREMGVSL